MDKFLSRVPTWKTMGYKEACAKYREPLQDQKRNENSNRMPAGKHSPFADIPGFNNIEASNENHLGNLRDYVSCTVQNNVALANVPPKSSQSTIPFVPLSNNNQDHLQLFRTPPPQQQPSQHKFHTPKQQQFTMMARIQQDLNSPSASVRLRAIKALKSPSKSAYSQFDVPHAEQNIISTEERRTPPPPPSMQELMSDIVVYVEVRTDEDNRSTGVKKVISALGARINDKLLRNTTHVVFKDGLLSTYKKAKHWNIPVVSILWIEACKNRRRICAPQEFPISNVDRYENPELYEKMKRHKFMQPDSECNKRIRKPGTGKSLAVDDASTSTAIVAVTPGTTKNTSKLPNTTLQKTDIRDYLNGKRHTTPISVARAITDSPATQLLHKYTNALSEEVSTPRNKSTCPTPVANVDHRQVTTSSGYGTAGLHVTPKYLTASTPVSAAHPQKRVTQRRRSALQETIDMAAAFVGELPLAQTLEDETPRPATRRRTSFCKSIQMAESTSTPRAVLRSDIAAIAEEHNYNHSIPMEESQTVPSGKRNTTYIGSMSLETTASLAAPLCEQRNEKPVNRRRTLYTPQRIEQSINASPSMALTLSTPFKGSAAIASSTLLETTQQKLSLLPSADESPSIPVFSSTRTSRQRRTLFDVSMDIITHRLESINQSAVCSLSATRSSENTAARLRKLNEGEATPTFAAKADTLTTASNEPNQNDAAAANSNDDGTPPVQSLFPKKKRKLFAPNNDSLLLLTSPSARRSTLVNGSTNAKRRRTLAPVPAMPHSDTNSLKEASDKASKAQRLACAVRRRSSLDFVERRAAAPIASQTAVDAAITEMAARHKAVVTPANGTVPIVEERQHRSSAAKAKRQLPFLVYTNMHKEQIEVIREALQKLGNYKLEDRVSDATTHVVSLEPRRTLNMLRALVRGLWLLDYSWVQDSLRAGKWLEEEQYEMRNFSRAVEICRAERQAFGRLYRCELFCQLGTFYVSSHSGQIDKADIVELIALCGGQVVGNRRSAKYIVGNINRTHVDKVYVTPMWIMDSITQMQLLCTQKYGWFCMPTSDSEAKQPVAAEAAHQQLPNSQVLQSQQV